MKIYIALSTFILRTIDIVHCPYVSIRLLSNYLIEALILPDDLVGLIIEV